MEVYQKFFSRLVVSNASTIFPGLNRPIGNPGNYQLLVAEVKKVAEDDKQASKIAEAIETASEDIFRDFDLATFMEHFKLDALEKTILALAFKTGSRTDLKNKGMDRFLLSAIILLTFFSRRDHLCKLPKLSSHGQRTPSKPRRFPE